MGLPQAQSDLGALPFYGRHSEIGYPEALSWLRAAAERGHPLAQVNLAGAYLTGGAMSWQGFEGAPFARPPGVTGNLIPRDEREAARWFLMAAEQGVVVAQLLRATAQQPSSCGSGLGSGVCNGRSSSRSS